MAKEAKSSGEVVNESAEFQRELAELRQEMETFKAARPNPAAADNGAGMAAFQTKLDKFLEKYPHAPTGSTSHNQSENENSVVGFLRSIGILA
jgi:hypothetical protein